MGGFKKQIIHDDELYEPEDNDQMETNDEIIQRMKATSGDDIAEAMIDREEWKTALSEALKANKEDNTTVPIIWYDGSVRFVTKAERQRLLEIGQQAERRAGRILLAFALILAAILALISKGG